MLELETRLRQEAQESLKTFEGPNSSLVCFLWAKKPVNQAIRVLYTQSLLLCPILCETSHPYYVYFPSPYLLLPKIHYSYFTGCFLRIRFLIQLHLGITGGQESQKAPSSSFQVTSVSLGKACTHIWYPSCCGCQLRSRMQGHLALPTELAFRSFIGLQQISKVLMGLGASSSPYIYSQAQLSGKRQKCPSPIFSLEVA